MKTDGHSTKWSSKTLIVNYNYYLSLLYEVHFVSCWFGRVMALILITTRYLPSWLFWGFFSSMGLFKIKCHLLQAIRSRYCCKSKRHEYLTLIFLTSSVLYIIAVHFVRVSSPEIHWWKNKNISFILGHLNLALSNYDGHHTYYTNYSTLKTSMDVTCSFPPDNLSKYEHFRSNKGVLHV